jgi:hypothetical protein
MKNTGLIIHRSFLLIPALAVGLFAAGCGSPESPSTPSDMLSAAPEVGASEKASTDFAAPCQRISAVSLRRLPASSRQQVVQIKATYLTISPSLGCDIGPEWSSRPLGVVTVANNSFVASVQRSTKGTETLVRAQAPNGVVGSIRVRW